MLKKLALLTMIAFTFLGACSKKSLEDNLGGGNGGGGTLTGDSKSAYTYLSYLYSSATGPQLNDAVLNQDLYTNYKDSVQRAVNVSLKFPFDTATRSKSTNISIDTKWYDTIPAGISLDQYGGDVAKAMEEYLKTASGRAYLSSYLTSVSTQMTNVSNFIASSTYPTSAAVELINKGVFVANAAATLFEASSGAGLLMAGLSLFSGLSGNSSDLGTVLVQLQQIQQKLFDIEKKIDKIISMIYEKNLTDAKEPIETAKGVLDDIYTQVNNYKGYPESQKNQIKAYFESGSTSFDMIIKRANRAAQYSLSYYLQNNIKTDNELQIPNVESSGNNLTASPLNAFYSCLFEQSTEFCKSFSFSNNTIKKYSIKKPLYLYLGYDSTPSEFDNTDTMPRNNTSCNTEGKNCGISPDEIALIKRMTLTKLNLYSYLYSGKDLLTIRKQWAESYKSTYLTPIKENLKKMANLINYLTEKNKYGNPKFLEYDLTNFPQNTIIKLQFLINNSFDSTVYNKPSFVNIAAGGDANAYYSTSEYINFLAGANTFLANALKNNIFNIAEYRDSYIAALALVADWEIQLNAHIMAADKAQ